MPGGRAPRAGDIFRFPDQAKTLEKIAATRGEAFYRGELAERIEAHARDNGGAMTRQDLAAHVNDWPGTISQRYRDLMVHEIPPNTQGIVTLMALGMLSHFDMHDHPVDSADSVHLQIEAVKLAFADAHRHVADPPWRSRRRGCSIPITSSRAPP
jgi:gamma-glutamyltranspeptidase / glutathione hydrolase